MGNGDDTSVEEVLPLDTRLYVKAALLIDNLNKVPHSLYIWNGFEVYILMIL